MDARILNEIHRIYDQVGRRGSGDPRNLGVAVGADLARNLGYPEAELLSVPPDVWTSFVGAAPLPCWVVGPAGQWVADLGCGAGADSLILAGRGHRVVSAEISAPMLDRLRRAHPAHSHSPPWPLRACLPDLPLRSGRFDWVLLNGVANLVADRTGLLAESSRLLRPSGRLLIADLLALEPLPEELVRAPEAWAWCVAGAAATQEWRSRLEQAGFEDIAVEVLEEISPLARGVIQASKGSGATGHGETAGSIVHRNEDLADKSPRVLADTAGRTSLAAGGEGR